MKNIKKPKVITIASISGGGKTTVTEKVNEALPNSKALFFDEYDLEGPQHIVDWLHRGADYHEWDITALVKDLEQLFTDNLDYIVLDFPFSYIHTQIRTYIDSSVFIDTPLDIALARRIIRDCQDDTTQNIIDDMKYYHSHGRLAYLEMLYTIQPSADIVIDGSLSVSEIVKKILEKA